MAIKSPNACASCRTRKQRCDKSLPSCSRCQSKLIRCDYTWINPKTATDPPQTIDLEATIIQHCVGCVDISTRSASELVMVSSSETNVAHFASLTLTALEAAGTTPLALLEEYLATIHPWMPIVDENKFRYRLIKWKECRDPKLTVLIWALYLVTRRPCATLHHSMQTLLYRSVRQMFVLQASAFPALETLQAGLLIAYYSCGHGFSRDAHITLATCVTQARLMGVSFHESGAGISVDSELSSCKWAIVLLDRAVVLSAITEPVPLALPLSLTSTAECLASLQDSKDAHRSFDISSRVALVLGTALGYANDLWPADLDKSSYGRTRDDLETLVQELIGTSKDTLGSYTYCESTSLAVIAHLALQVVNPITEAIVPDSKEGLLLQSTLRMAREQLLAFSHLLPGGLSDVVPVVPLCTMSRAAAITIRQCGSGLPMEELEELRANLKRFSKRWTLARGFEGGSVS